MPPSLLSKERDPEITEVLDDLVRDSLHVLLTVASLVTWVWAAFVCLFVKPHFECGFGVLALILGATWTSYRLSKKHLGLAIGVFLLALAIAVMVITLSFQNPAALYLYVLVVLVTAVLTSPPITWGVALIGSLLVWLIGRDGSLAAAYQVDAALPTIIILLSALTAWMSSRRLLTALTWALDMTRQAHKNADEARKHRAEVVRVLKSLDEAYARLERANEALLYAQEAAEKAYRFKAAFVANVSHELRTPLNLITGFSGMMVTAPESYGGASLPSEFRGDLMAIHRSARHLSDLINDVLDLSRIEAGSMPLVREKVDLREVVREAADMVRGLADARGLEFTLDMPDELSTLSIDRTRIRQVLLNLLTNALRFTDKGWVRVRVRVEQQEIVVTVEDSGRGIARDRIASAFEAFTQLGDGQVREGSGLGLAVSKRFVELHGGRMWIDSEMGRGTTVGFSLPILSKEALAEMPRLAASASPPGHRGEPLVLVVHDDPRVLSLFRRYVGEYQFALAETVGRAREMIPETFPIAVIADASRADHGALTATDLGLPSHIPLLICPLPSMHRLGLLMGAADYLPKPVTQEDLQGALARLPAPLRRCSSWTTTLTSSDCLRVL